MTQKSNPVPSSEVVEGEFSQLPGNAGVSRRKLIRAGLSAAPVVAALKSNSVLAGSSQCVKPSAFASLKHANFNHSRWDANNMGCGCIRPQDWCNMKYSCKDTKLSACDMSNRTKLEVKCWSGGKWDYPDVTFHDLFNRTDLTGDCTFARKVAACYANAVQYGEANSPLTKSECQAIWRTGGAGWTPVSGGSAWTREDTDKFFSMLFGA